MNIQNHSLVKLFKSLLCAFFIISLITINANFSFACENGNPKSCFVDRNKDGRFKFVFIGDSFIKGVGDINDDGGYVKRLKKDFRDNFDKVPVAKIARPGRTTKEVFTYIKQNIYKKPAILKRIKDADAIIIDLGRNDYWDKRPVIYSINTLKRLIKFLKKNSNNKREPFVTASTLVHVSNKRLAQLDFVKQFNAELLKYPLISGEILQHTFPTTILSEDGLHPSPEGYDYIYEQLREQITTTLYEVMLFKQNH